MSALHHCTRALLAKHSARPSPRCPRRISIATHCALILALALSSPSQDAQAQAQAQAISIPADEARNTTVDVATDSTTLTLDGEITTDGEAAIAVTGANLSLTHRGAITTENANANGIVLNGANPVLLMPRGSIDIMGASVGIFADSDATNTRITLGDRDADPIGTAADGTANACNPMIHACISTRGAQGHGVPLGTFGAADPDNNPDTEDNVYEIITRANSRISTQGTGAHGIFVRDTPNSTAQAQLNLFGEIVVTGQDAIGVNIADSTGGATFGFFVPGRISATGNASTAIQDAAAATNLFLSSTARITGDINLGGGNDAITLAAGARVAGDIDLGAGNDTLNIRATLTGNVDGGAGDDTFTFRPGGEITGTLAGGMGDDTLNFLLLSDAQRRSVRLTDAMTGTGEASFLNTDGAAGVAGFTGIETLTGEVEEFIGVADSHARWTLAPMDIRYQALTAAASDPGAMDFGLPLTLPATTSLLAGANLSDTFIISTAFQGSLNGGAGNDVFRFQPNGAIASNLTGGAGADHLDYSARPGFIGIILTASDADGFSGTAPAITGSIEGIDQLTGGMDSSQLIGLDSDATWTLGVDAQGNERNTYALIRAVPDGQLVTDTLIFSGFDRFDGQTGADTFNIDADHQRAIVLDGSGGDDVFNIRTTVRSQFNTALVGSSGDDRFIFANDGVVLSTNTSQGNIGGDSGNDSLQGDNDGNAFTITGSNQGTLAEKIAGQFFNIENLIGGTGADTFTFDDAGNLTGNLTGGAGADTLDYSARTDDIIITLTGSDATGFSSGAVVGSRFVLVPTPAVVETPITGGFSGIDQLTANANGLNQLRGDDAAATWTVDTAGTTYALMRSVAGGPMATDTLSFSGFDDLIGGSMADTFTINVENLSLLVSGGAGNDRFNINAGIRSISGGAGNDTFTFGAAGRIGIPSITPDTNPLRGEAGTDTLIGDNNGNTFTLTGNGEGTLMDKIGGGFTNIENLTGGSMADTFTFQVGSTLTGNITGGMGSDHLDYSAVTGDISTTLDGSNATGFSSAVVTITNLPQLPPDDVQRLTGGFTGINQLTGGTGTDSLTGDDADATWTLGADAQGNERNSYALMRSVVGGQPATDTLTFSSFENLTGGSLADTFNINAAHSGDLDGRGGTDSFDIRATLTGALTGGAGADRFTLHADGRIAGGSLAGGTGTDTLIGNNNGNAFSLTGNNNGQLADSAGTALIANGFTGIENLTGGTGNDRFAFAAAGSLSGNLVGGAGSDHLDYSARTDSLSATLTASDATGFEGGAVMAAVAAGQTPITGGFTGINQLTGGTATDSLTGNDADATWTLGADAQGNERNSYALMRSVVGGQPATDTLTFSNFENLTGGSLADTFNVNAAHSGDLDGGAGADTFNIANTLMGNIDGGAGDDTFTFSGAGAITGTLAGGTGDDTLNFMALSDVERLSVMMTDAATGTGVASFINGGGAAGFTGIETLEGFLMRFTGDANRHARWTLASAGNSYQALTAPASDPNAETVGASINLTASVNTLVGGDLSDTFDIATAFDGTLQGGAGDNTFTFADGGSIAGSITGGMGTDHLNYGARTAPISVTLTASDATGFAGGPVVATRTQTPLTGGFTGIDRLTGGTGTDSLTGHNADATWTLGTAGNSYAVGNQSLVFSSFENLSGGSMADSFTLSIDHTGNLDAGAGDDVFNLADGGEVGEIAGGAGTDHRWL